MVESPARYAIQNECQIELDDTQKRLNFQKQIYRVKKTSENEAIYGLFSFKSGICFA
jgi:hypothetical protein